MRHRLLTHLSTLIFRRPLAITLLCLLTAVASASYAALTLRLNSDTNDLIAADRPFMVQYRKFLAEFGDLEFILLIVDSPHNPEAAASAINDLLPRLKKIPGLNQIHGIITPEEQLTLATRAMTEPQLSEFQNLTAALSPYSTKNITPEILLRDALAGLKSNTDESSFARSLTLLNLLLSSPLLTPQKNSPSVVSVCSVVNPLLPTPPNQYLTSPSGRFSFIRIQPRKDFSTLAAIEKPLTQIRQVIKEVQARHPAVEIGLTGKPVLQTDEMLTTRRDMTIATSIAFVLITILLMLAFHGLWRPLLAVIALACGISWTFALAALIIGQLNLLSIVFTIILVGVGIDYGIHLLSRYLEQRKQESVKEALTNAMTTVGRGNLTGAVTSSFAFFGAMLGDFQGLRELGFIAGCGLLFCLLAISTALPAMLVLLEQRKSSGALGAMDSDQRESSVPDPPHPSPPHPSPPHPTKNPLSSHLCALCASVVNFPPLLTRHPRKVVGGLLLLTLLFIPQLRHLEFESNLLNLQAEGLDSVNWEHRLLEESSDAVWFGAITTDSLADLRHLINRAESLPSIGHISSVFDLIQPNDSTRQQIRKQLHNHKHNPNPIPPSAQKLTPAQLQAASAQLNAMADSLPENQPDLAANLRRQSHKTHEFALNLTQNPSLYGTTKTSLITQYANLNSMLKGDLQPLRDALPAALRDSMISPQQGYLAMIHPRENVWEYEPLRRFVADLRSLDPSATGVPMTHFESLGEMQTSFRLAAVVALIMVLIILMIDFRGWRDPLIAMLPVLLGLLWLTEIMALLHIKFNLANFFAIPILIGLAVDNGVHLLHRYRHQGNFHRGLGATSRAVVLTSVTTIIGFGLLTTATHRGLHSLGLVMTIGVGCCLLSSLLLLPAIFAWMDHSRKSENPAPAPTPSPSLK